MIFSHRVTLGHHLLFLVYHSVELMILESAQEFQHHMVYSKLFQLDNYLPHLVLSPDSMNAYQLPYIQQEHLCSVMGATTIRCRSLIERALRMVRRYFHIRP